MAATVLVVEDDPDCREVLGQPQDTIRGSKAGSGRHPIERARHAIGTRPIGRAPLGSLGCRPHL